MSKENNLPSERGVHADADDTASDSSGLSGLRAGDIPRTNFAPSQKQQDGQLINLNTLISRTHCHATDCFSEHLGFGRGSSHEEPPGGGLQLRNRLYSSESSDGVTYKDPSNLSKSFTTHFEPAFVRGLDRKGRPSLDACNIVNRQRDEMIAPFLSRMKEMEDRITSRVIDHIESTLDKQLRQLRDDLDGELEDNLDDRVDVVREEMKEPFSWNCDPWHPLDRAYFVSMQEQREGPRGWLWVGSMEHLWQFPSQGFNFVRVSNMNSRVKSWGNFSRHAWRALKSGGNIELTCMQTK
ncbi:hypothetical protein M406DRAFT_326262 [Cryphonectria parasitica EP155]|uniref:Uncharacterized protein n=1 Tax=Cryphonectria parasitica (strain ATCC 38755 / EP155) TaxID=660469 RepID=A0A9P4YD32_CRYP1|nr:uncharacterized protein M406DRAFT_326262 [Cryphonectria parasitica EP155]KAF3770845.1 hypothetical protein M406DRAFT_326262 [Cryphonectria parasitica EP155]